jgi:hypothetical protein
MCDFIKIHGEYFAAESKYKKGRCSIRIIAELLLIVILSNEKTSITQK